MRKLVSRRRIECQYMRVNVPRALLQLSICVLWLTVLTLLIALSVVSGWLKRCFQPRKGM